MPRNGKMAVDEDPVIGLSPTPSLMPKCGNLFLLPPFPPKSVSRVYRVGPVGRIHPSMDARGGRGDSHGGCGCGLGSRRAPRTVTNVPYTQRCLMRQPRGHTNRHHPRHGWSGRRCPRRDTQIPVLHPLGNQESGSECHRPCQGTPCRCIPLRRLRSLRHFGTYTRGDVVVVCETERTT